MSLQAPVDDAGRIRSLALRGLALLGILLANVRQMFLPWEISDFPLSVGGAPGLVWADWAFWHALVDLKFLTIFSLLFGIGFALQAERLLERGSGFAGIYLRRVAILAFFGIVHGLLLYPAEVLTGYAVAGLLLLLARSLSADALMRAGLVLLGTATLWSYQIGTLGRISLPKTALAAAALSACVVPLSRRSWTLALSAWALVLLAAGALLTLRSDLAPGVASEFESARKSLLAITVGDAAGWPEEMRARHHGTLGSLVALHARQYADVLLYFAILLVWRTLGLFMIGAGLYRHGLLTEDSPALRRHVVTVGVGLGLPLSLLATWLHGRELAGLADSRFPRFLHEWSALLLAAGLVAAILTLQRLTGLLGLVRPVEAAGRMALSNYIGQSLVMAALAEPWGLNLYARLRTPLLTGLAIAVFLALAFLSQAWLARFKMGPLEWLWRCGTYRRWLPNRAVSPLPGTSSGSRGHARRST